MISGPPNSSSLANLSSTQTRHTSLQNEHQSATVRLETTLPSNEQSLKIVVICYIQTEILHKYQHVFDPRF